MRRPVVAVGHILTTDDPVPCKLKLKLDLGTLIANPSPQWGPCAYPVFSLG